MRTSEYSVMHPWRRQLAIKLSRPLLLRVLRAFMICFVLRVLRASMVCFEII